MSCQCASLNVYLLPPILLISLLSSSSFAQDTDATTSPSPLTTSTNPPTNPSTTLAMVTTLPSPSITTPNTPAQTSDTRETVQTHLFNYYFLILAVLAVLLALVFVYYGRRRRNRAAILRANGQYALARDVDGWRGTWGINTNWVNRRYAPATGMPGYRSARTGRWNNVFGFGDREGLNERGEAPPPYVPEDKPPSISAAEGTSRNLYSRAGAPAGAVELAQMDAAASRPPRYDESVGTENEAAPGGSRASVEEGSASIRRPDRAVTVPRRSDQQ
ncbi:hypothetical protein F5884DRAFT_783615 [Xylogone sp. PMI_703]|nr:hypothetical protein F5884DRAFT_783615 [Xylogone sp. PMI_703]